MSKMREIILRPAVVLPAMSTSEPERTLTHLQFLDTFVVAAPELKVTAKLGRLFAWVDALEEFTAIIDARLPPAPPDPELPPEPPDPGERPADKDQLEAWEAATATAAAWELAARPIVEAHAEALLERGRALGKASEGERIYLDEDDFDKGIAACKDYLDALVSPSVDGRSKRQGDAFLPEARARKVLRLFHATAQSKAVDAKDVVKTV